VILVFEYTAYLDESGTHDASPITVMGGILARADQWRDFERKFAAVQSQFGFKVWHTKKFKKRAGDFRGWTDEKCRELYRSLADVNSSGLTDVVAVTLNNASYEADYRAGKLPRRARLDTKRCSLSTCRVLRLIGCHRGASFHSWHEGPFAWPR
jgi:hypothetical protein